MKSLFDKNKRHTRLLHEDLVERIARMGEGKDVESLTSPRFRSHFEACGIRDDAQSAEAVRVRGAGRSGRLSVRLSAGRSRRRRSIRPPKGGLYDIKPALDRYCVTCHNEKLKTAGLSLEQIDPTRVGRDPDTWEKVARKLRTHEMPPPGLPRPDQCDLRAAGLVARSRARCTPRPPIRVRGVSSFTA